MREGAAFAMSRARRGASAYTGPSSSLERENAMRKRGARASTARERADAEGRAEREAEKRICSTAMEESSHAAMEHADTRGWEDTALFQRSTVADSSV